MIIWVIRRLVRHTVVTGNKGRADENYTIFRKRFITHRSQTDRTTTQTGTQTTTDRQTPVGLKRRIRREISRPR